MSSKSKLPAFQQEIIENLLNRVKNMSEDEFKSMMRNFQNFRTYSFYNRCLIHASGASQVAGYEKWQELKRQVKKKEEHTLGRIPILAPSFCYQIYKGGKWLKATEKQYKAHDGKKEKYLTHYFTVYVFDIQDTFGEPLPEPMTPKSKITYSRMETVARELGYTIERRPLEFNKGGFISDKHIVINENRQESANVGTVIHELAHGELGHTDTLNEDPKDLKEVQAEIVTYLVCLKLGVERNSELYLKAWGASENIMSDMYKLSSVADKIEKAIRPNSMAFILED